MTATEYIRTVSRQSTEVRISYYRRNGIKNCEDYRGNHVMVNKKSGSSLRENWPGLDKMLDFFSYLNLILNFLLLPYILLRSVALP